ncbi:hypothetical protein FHS16_005444 [Paenibacillus endophyticus]|uniref:Uncharacterized protein n=1 Tax=Paenibacillus endophyticus TaxID=1294268 RepID=A0A7W5GCX3_9BACL|nr:hypothetical protein [Paenibacillus endophyticus]MBB3155336.1 hypothetical protein [Paenibacillus endophyticus]
MFKALVWIVPGFGLYVIYKGFVVLLTQARGESVYELGMLIPATTPSLITYGSIFVLAGLALICVPFLFRKIRFKEPLHSTNETG